MTKLKASLITGSMMLAAILVLSYLAFTPARAQDLKDLPKLSLNCFIGGSVGTAASANRIGNGSVQFDVGGTGPLLSGEAGCFLPVGSLNAIAVIRADLQKLSASVQDTTLTQNARYMAFAGPVFTINQSFDLYLAPALVFSRVSYRELQSNTISGYGGVAGFNLDIGKTNLTVFGEYNYLSYRNYAVGTDAVAKPSESIVRTGIRFKF